MPVTDEQRRKSAELLADVAIRRVRHDVPDDVIEAIGVALRVFAAEARELDALVYDEPEAAEIRERRQRRRREALDRWEATR